MHLTTDSFVTLDDANGLVTLTVQAAESAVVAATSSALLAQQNTLNPANFDLSILYDPAGGVAGMSAPPVLETFSDLSLTPGPNYVVTKINAVSRFIPIPAAPPGAIRRRISHHANDAGGRRHNRSEGLGGTTYLTVQPTNPASWPPLFGVLAQDDLTVALDFNLLVVYAPPSEQWSSAAGSRRGVRLALARDCRHRHRRIGPRSRAQLSKTSQPQPLGLRPVALRRQSGESGS